MVGNQSSARQVDARPAKPRRRRKAQSLTYLRERLTPHRQALEWLKPPPYAPGYSVLFTQRPSRHIILWRLYVSSLAAAANFLRGGNVCKNPNEARAMFLQADRASVYFGKDASDVAHDLLTIAALRTIQPFGPAIVKRRRLTCRECLISFGGPAGGGANARMEGQL